MRDILFALDEPQYHTVRIGEVNHFRGAVLAIQGEPVRALRVYRENEMVGGCRVDRPCPEWAFLPIPNAETSRFEFDLRVIEGPPYVIRRGDDAADATALFEFDANEANDVRLRRLGQGVEALPVPPSSIVAVTQGGDNAEAYRNAIVSGFATSEMLLREAGVDPESLQSILDIGCGTGRLLIGWHLSRDQRRTVGVDVNAELIAWNNSNLRRVAEWYQVPALPPLCLESEGFDLIILASVFTHLPLAWQRVWVTEITRLLRPGGVVLLTLNGSPYVSSLLDSQGRELFAQAGYAEGIGGVPGANSFSTYHSERFATELVQPLVPLAVFPSGHSRGRTASWFPMAAWQDVYVLQRPRGPARNRGGET